MNTFRLNAYFFTLMSLCTTTVSAADIPFNSIKSDISYLASDKLQGRASFTPGAELAANYISKRFKEIGLQPINGSYKQTFSVYVRHVNSSSVYINQQKISATDIAIAANSSEIDWQEDDSVNVTHIGPKDNLRSIINKLNQQGDNHLVFVDPSHKALFKRYQAFFAHPKTKMDDKDNGSLVMVLTSVEKPSKFTIAVKSELTQKSLTNVIGVLPGRSKNNESVIYSAHYDHIGTLKNPTEKNQDVIFNGADDDASGVTGVINLAQYFKKQNNNQRRIVFVAFAAEEIGGFGSRYFSQHLEANNIVAMINMEMIGKPSKFGAGKLWMTGYERSDLAKIMNSALATKGSEIYPDPYPKQRLFYRSDNATLARLRVPAHSFSSTQIDKDPHYHKTSDELKTLDLKSMQQVIETIADASSSLLSGKATPTRIDKSKLHQSGLIF